jgi:hypothetical protein
MNDWIAYYAKCKNNNSGGGQANYVLLPGASWDKLGTLLLQVLA